MQNFVKTVTPERAAEYHLENLSLSTVKELESSIKTTIESLKITMTEETLKEVNKDFVSALSKLADIKSLKRWIFWNILDAFICDRLTVPSWMVHGYKSIMVELSTMETNLVLKDLNQVDLAQVTTSLEMCFWIGSRFFLSQDLGNNAEKITVIFHSVMGILNSYQGLGWYQKEKMLGLEKLKSFAMKNRLGNEIDQLVVGFLTRTMKGQRTKGQSKKILSEIASLIVDEKDVVFALKYLSENLDDIEESSVQKHIGIISSFLNKCGCTSRFWDLIETS